MFNHYKELFESSVSELKFANLRIDNYKNIIREIELLINSWVDKKLISKVIENFRQRDVLDISINYDIKVWINDTKLK